MCCAVVKGLKFVTNTNNRKDHALAIFCNLCKAFDIVDHVILMKKLKKLHGTDLKWFEDTYLIGNCLSQLMVLLVIFFLFVLVYPKDQFSALCYS
jgi:hypothetical protein